MAITKRIFACVTTLVAFAIYSNAHASFIIEPNGLASANYFATNATGNSTVAGAGTLAAPGLTPGAASVFGGEPYVYTYTPAVDGSNTVFAAGTSLNGFAGYTSDGLAAGGTGDYNVYLTYPESGNQTGMPALYDIDVDGDGTADVSASYDQNMADAGTGFGIGLWELVGTITVTDANQPITLTIDAGTTPTFVGVRTAGVLFDPVVPEPSSIALLGAAIGMLSLARRR